jgi:hypothetical protein
LFEGLNSKSSIVIQKVAEELLFVELDSRIPKIDDLSQKYNVGRGTVQSVLKKLEETRCISLESRGHMGTFLRSKNVNLLLQCCGLNNIVGVMPLPYSRKYEGLATALHEVFEKFGLSLHSAFMRGATIRINNVLEDRYDFALVSKFSANEAVAKNDDLMIVKDFGPNSYVSRHTLIFAEDKKEIEDGMKIGVDSYSIDQQVLTQLEVKERNVEYVNLNYMHLLKHLKAKLIDAMVWNMDEIDSSSLHLSGLTTPEALEMDHEMSQAVCVIRKNNKKIEYLFNLISTAEIVKTQQDVESGKCIPKY